MMDEKFLKPYNPQETEDAIYEKWIASGFFSPEGCVGSGVTTEDAEPYTIVLPPPNVTGVLHIGHAAMLAVEDILVRYHRMRGYKTLWIPGTDHAAIATQSKVEKVLQKEEGKSRHDLGREEFLKRVNAFAQDSHDTIVKQVRKMGSSLDWNREAFTLDDTRQRAVYEAFERLYALGLIIRKNRVVNWDPKGQTVISDDEIVYEERDAVLYTFRYNKDFPIAISTTRPETKVGDTAVAVHPDDARYKEYVGKEYDAVFCDVPLHIRVIADTNVDPTFGTGALGVTPAHSMIDADMAERHNLPAPQVINEYAKMTVEGHLNGLKTLPAREAVVVWLKEGGLLEKEEKVKQNVSTAERTGGVIEPLPKLQWFIAVNKPFTLAHSIIPGVVSGSETTLKELMRTAVESGAIHINPDRFEKTYFHWIDNLRDWCISRQIWYGHRIPVWYQGDEIHVGATPPAGGDWSQDPDTLDTWFSSGLWTFSTLGWPEKTSDMKKYHPTTILETGYDILFFWVARMILMSTALLGEVPFRDVYLHGLVRDEKGRKMSKSLGNTIDPITLIEKYGADATRLSLIIGAAAGNDIKLSEQRVKGYKNFTNKLWNVTRFVLQSRDEIAYDTNVVLHEDDARLLAELKDFMTDVTSDIEAFRLYLAGEKLYHFLWHRFADVILEESKPMLQGDDALRKASRVRMLYDMLVIQLKLLHPFMPFVTEEIWSSLPEKDRELIMVSSWPA
jgi:valyl-tRNA synthetase